MPPRIFVRNLGGRTETTDSRELKALRTLFFSPDGDWLGFQQGQQIKKVALAGGSPAVVVENLDLTQGAGLSGPPGNHVGKERHDRLPRKLGSGLSMVRDTGGKPEEFTTLDPAANEVSHRCRTFFPMAAVVFTVLRFSAVTPDWSRAQVWVKSIEERRAQTPARERGRRAVRGETTRWSLRREGKLFAVRFDPSSLTVSGPEVQVLDGVIHSVRGTAATKWTGAAQFSIATTGGSLFYAPGSVEPPLLS